MDAAANANATFKVRAFAETLARIADARGAR